MFAISHCITYLPIFQLAPNTQYLDPEEVGKNELMLNMLRLMKMLVAYGFYFERDSVQPVITLLIDIIGSLLHLTCHTPFTIISIPFVSSCLDAGHVAEDSTENRVVFAVKSE